MEQYEKLTDEQLIEKLHSGDRDVTDYLMEKYKMMVRKKARAMYLIGGETEDPVSYTHLLSQEKPEKKNRKHS